MSIADKLTTIAENIPKVYDKGKADVELKFWEMLTDNGNRIHFQYAFGSSDYTGYSYVKPIKIKGNAQRIFYNYSGTEYPKNIDFSEIDTSKAYNSEYYSMWFRYGTNITTVPDMGIPALPGYPDMYANMPNLHTIVIVRSNENTMFTGTFASCPKLENITFEGTIGQNISFSGCNELTHDTLVHIIEHLKDYGETATHTLTIGSTNLAKLSDTEKAIATQKGWTLA